MSTLIKVMLAAAAGSIVASYVEPKITPHLPSSLTGGGLAGKATHLAITGITAGGVFWVIKGAAS